MTDPIPPRHVRQAAAGRQPHRRLSGGQRWLLAGAGLGLIALLVAAYRLVPDRRGLGTHQQLGLPPCTLMVVAGIRCPSCGMTTAWSYLTHGNIEASLRANPGGTLLAGLAFAFVPLALIGAISGRWWPGDAMTWGLLVWLATSLVVAGLDWLIRFVY
jgi:hypothetical protein